MSIEMIEAVKCPHCGEVTDIGGLVGPNTNNCPRCGKPALVQDPQPATPTQPTQGVFMDNFQAPNLIGIIMQALEQHIEAMVDKRFNERMADSKMPDLEELKDHVTEMVDERMSEINEEIDYKIAEAISDHTSEYDHDEYDQCVSNVDNAGLDDLEEKVKDIISGLTITLDV